MQVFLGMILIKPLCRQHKRPSELHGSNMKISEVLSSWRIVTDTGANWGGGQWRIGSIWGAFVVV